MPQSDDTIMNFPLPDQDNIQNFILDESLIRGRVLRLNTVLDKVIIPHDLPSPIAQLMAETIALSSLLSSMLKYEGVFILQIQGKAPKDTPMSMIVCDVNSDGHIRACANYSKERYDAFIKDNQKKKDKPITLADMFGDGYLAFTVDQGAHTERYQGIVGLDGKTLEECIQRYFEQSEQIETVIRLAVDYVDEAWRAGGIMLQRTPLKDEDVQNEIKDKSEENWVRSSILLKTCKDSELLDVRLHEDTLLFRLFHEEGIRTLDSKVLQAKCRCSEERLISVLATMPADDIAYIIKDGKISMTCEFCKKEYAIIPPDELL